MNCPHCTKPIADALVASAAASLATAKRKRHGPVGTPTACQRCGQVFPSTRECKYHRCPAKRARKSPPIR